MTVVTEKEDDRTLFQIWHFIVKIVLFDFGRSSVSCSSSKYCFA